MTRRGKWQGMLAIVRFNWPFYAIAFAVVMVSIAAWLLLQRYELKLVCAVTVGLVGYFVVGSLVVSHLVYDRSDLYRWGWLERALNGISLRHAIFCHCGYDEASVALAEKFGAVQWRVLDHFDPRHMTEQSIHRARASFPAAPGTFPSRYDAWPSASNWADAVFALLAIHELRSESERTAWMAECKRSLRDGGRLLLVEHVRDAANLAAFGPGFLHFHSSASWRRCWQRAGLSPIDEFRITPFVRIFVLAKI
jgi:hypothetical protein